jgi:Signal peptidase, peptidase S26
MRTLIFSLAVIASATISAQSAAFQRGELVRVLRPIVPSEPKTPVLDPDALKRRAGMVLKVVATPNDRIRIEKSAIYINDVQVTGFSPDFVARAAGAPERVPQVVPEGHYFVMGEQRINQNVSEHWGQHFGGQLEREPQ